MDPSVLSDSLKEFLDHDPHFEVTVADFIERSKQHPIGHPVNANRIEYLLKGIGSNPYQQGLRNKGKVYDEQLASKYINSAYPIVHENLLPLLAEFLHFKKESDQATEREFYKDKSVFDLINKLLQNRPVVFMSPSDSFRLDNRVAGFGGFEGIGRDGFKKAHFTLDKLNSYDEMRLAALVSVSSHSHFINRGDRNNCGQQGTGGDHEVEGVIVGQVGARFERFGQMDWQDCGVSREQNTAARGYGRESAGHRADLLRAWARLWGMEYFPLYEEIGNNAQGFEAVRSTHSFLNKNVYKKRIEMLAQVLLVEASHRAKEEGKRAYVVIVGLGLGVWMLSGQAQTPLYLRAWLDAALSLSEGVREGISVMDFTHISPVLGEVNHGSKIPGTDITVKFSKRGLHERVPEGLLLVCNFAWDSNSAPGNEYWNHCLAASGDPAAASSSGVAELHNTRINERISARTLRVASPQHGVLTVPQYLALVGGKA